MGWCWCVEGRFWRVLLGGLITTGRAPYSHQEAGARFLRDRPGAVLADEQGVGKTDTAVHAVIQAGLWPCLVVCPANVRVIWERVFGAVAPWVRWFYRVPWMRPAKGMW